MSFSPYAVSRAEYPSYEDDGSLVAYAATTGGIMDKIKQQWTALIANKSKLAIVVIVIAFILILALTRGGGKKGKKRQYRRKVRTSYVY